MIVSDTDRPVLSEAAASCKVRLEGMAGTDHVVITIQADGLPVNRARIAARRI
jgi:hypothetical protein